MLGRRWIATSIAVLVATLAVAGEARAFTWEGRCDQTAAVVPADAAIVREYVPAGWPIYEIAGQAPLLVTGGTCREQRVDGVALPASHWGLVSVFSADPKGSSDPGHGYDIWWFHSDRRLARAMRRGGFAAPFVHRLRAAVTPGPVGPTSGWVSVPWGRRAFAVTATLAPVSLPPAPMPITTFHWHAGSRGRVLLAPEHEGLTLTLGAGRVDATPGSPIARMIGGASAVGAGGILQFSFAGTAEPQ